MRNDYKRLGDYIELVDQRNEDLSVDILLGLSISKEFIPSVANTIGTNMKRYKIVHKNQFACSIMQVRRDGKMPVAILKSHDKAIISQAYPVFKVKDESVLNPDYLMMWFKRKEFDREATFHAVGGVRGSLEWGDFMNFKLPIPPIKKQREIVAEYNAVDNRIRINEQLNQKLEETAQAIYKHWFIDNVKDNWEKVKLDEICNLITDGKHGNCKDEINSGYYFISVKDITNSNIYYKKARQITKSDFEETHKRTNLQKGDILMTNAGTIGRLAITKDLPETRKTTFQKSVAIIKPNKDLVYTYFLYSMLKFSINQIKELAGGSTQSNLLISDLKYFEVLYPGFDAIKKYEGLIKPIFLKIEDNWKECLGLENFKNLLLSKMSKVEVEKEME